jgi:hypothetical protein
MSLNKLYYISHDVYSQELCQDFFKNIIFYINLKDALDELDNIYKKDLNLKWYGFCIKTLIKKENKYIQSHETYYHQKGYS